MPCKWALTKSPLVSGRGVLAICAAAGQGISAVITSSDAEKEVQRWTVIHCSTYFSNHGYCFGA
ncbi:MULTISPECIES: hypothetical protein [Prochlorococcus]|uniref:hypothetical protein n=1 Tax=Prochlorococcus TaxID=1218 RepID=UPI001F3A5F47|nr:hypothetical protein [Prochlorococcus marinus]